MFSQGLITEIAADNCTSINQIKIIRGRDLRLWNKSTNSAKLNNTYVQKKPDNELSRDQVAHHHFVVPVCPIFRQNFNLGIERRKYIAPNFL